MGLLPRRDGIRHGMQEDAVLSQRLAMVRDVEQRRIGRRAEASERLDGAVQQVVRIEQGVVVGVDDLGDRALREIGLPALGLETAELRRISQVVARTVAAEHVQHDHLARRERTETAPEILEHRAVHAGLARLAELRMLARIGAQFRDVAAHALAARVVAVPAPLPARLAEDVDEVVARPRARRREALAAEIREHAGHGDRGGGAAGRHLREVDQVGSGGELGHRLSRVPVHRDILGARGLAHHQHENERPVDAPPRHRPARASRSRGGHRQPRAHARAVADRFVGERLARRLRRIAADAGDPVHRHQHMAQLAVVAQQRGMVLVEAGGDQADRREGRDHCPDALQQFATPRQPLQGPAQHQHRGQHAQQRDVPEQLHVDELRRLDRVGLEHVADHRLVDEHAVGEHEIRRERTEHEHQREQRLGERPHEREHRQEEVDHHGCEQRQRREEHDVLEGRRRPQRPHASPERGVERQQAPERDEGRQRDRGQRTKSWQTVSLRGRRRAIFVVFAARGYWLQPRCRARAPALRR